MEEAEAEGGSVGEAERGAEADAESEAEVEVEGSPGEDVANSDPSGDVVASDDTDGVAGFFGNTDADGEAELLSLWHAVAGGEPDALDERVAKKERELRERLGVTEGVGEPMTERNCNAA